MARVNGDCSIDSVGRAVIKISPQVVDDCRLHSGCGLRVFAPWFFLALVAARGLGLPAPARGEDSDEQARLTFTKVLEGSNPEYLFIAVDSNGEGSYEGRQLAAPPNRRPLRLSTATTRKLFELAATLGYFQSIDLESHKKVADLGRKTFVYESGGRQNRVEFNYTKRKEARELSELFEKIAAVQQHISALEYAIKYDHLSLPKELQQISLDLEKNALADPELMVPALERIARNRRFLNLAQVRARDILQRIRNSD